MKKLKGFTLIELLIVVVILGILATFVILTLSSATKKTKESRAKDSVKSVQSAMGIVAADTTDLTTLGFTGGVLTPLNATNYIKIKDVDGKQLLGNIPLDGQDQPVQLRVYNNGNYDIVARSATNTGSCWKYSSSTGGNLGNNSPDAASCN